MLYIYITRLASNVIFSPSNKIHREIGRANELSVPLYLQWFVNYSVIWWRFLGQHYHQHENIQQSIYDITLVLPR